MTEPQPEHVEEYGHTQAAGRAQQAKAQELFDTPQRDHNTTEDFDFVCPECGGDANKSSIKPFCSGECQDEALANVDSEHL